MRDAKGAAQLVRRDAVLGIGNQPNGGEPLVKAKARVLEDGANLERELAITNTALSDATSRAEDGVTFTCAFQRL